MNLELSVRDEMLIAVPSLRTFALSLTIRARLRLTELLQLERNDIGADNMTKAALQESP